MKKTLKRIALTLLNLFCFFLPKKNRIVFESNPDLACNSFELYLNMMNDERFNNYFFVWLVSSPDNHKSDNRTSFIGKFPHGFLAIIKKYIICNRSKIVVASCLPFDSRRGNKKQLNIFLDHGSPLKDIRTNGTLQRINCTYMIAQSDFFVDYLLNQYTIRKEQLIVIGTPRNDQFFKSKKDMTPIVSDWNSFRKVIAWVPTFRKSKERIDCDSNLPLGLPIIYSSEEAIYINDILKKNNTLLIVKPHPAQDLTVLKEIMLSNVRFIYDNEMIHKEIQTNELLMCCDAIITDYSGIYYDFLLTKRPIAITLDDYEEYKKQHGFVFEKPLDILKGRYVYNKTDLIDFLLEVCNDNDPFLNERERINQIVNQFQDGFSSKRLCDFIAEKIKNK